jgi:hypothetical protein
MMIGQDKGKRLTCTRWHTLEVFYRVPYPSAREWIKIEYALLFTIKLPSEQP